LKKGKRKSFSALEIKRRKEGKEKSTFLQDQKGEKRGEAIPVKKRGLHARTQRELMLKPTEKEKGRTGEGTTATEYFGEKKGGEALFIG